MLLGLLLLLLLAIPGHAAIYYFDPVAGSNSNDCLSEGAACQTEAKFNTLAASAAPGDQFLWKRGTTRNVSTTLQIPQGSAGTAGAPILLGAYGSGAKPILNGTAVPGGNNVVRCRDTAWWIVQDLQFTGAKGAMVMEACTDMVFQRNLVTQCNQSCLLIRRHENGTFSARVTVRENVFNTTSAEERIYVSTDPAQDGGIPDPTQDVLIEHNEITGTSTHECIELKAGAQRVTVQHNYIHDTTVGVQNGCIYSSRHLSTYPAGHHVITGNWLENISGSAGYPIRLRNTATIRGNVVLDAAQHGIYLEQPGTHPTHTRLIEYNTVVDNTGACISSAGGGNTIANNICWGNGSGNDASNPLFVNAGAGDYRLQAGSPSLTKGALRPFSLTAPVIQPNGTSVVLSATPALPPVRDCSASAAAFTVTCTTAGALQAQTCGASDTTVTLGLGATVAQGDTACVLDVTASTLLDSARVGGSLGPNLSATHFVVEDLAVTNNSTTGSGGETAPNLLTLANSVPGTCPECAVDRPWAALLDLDVTTEAGSAGNSTITSFTGEHDLGASTPLETFRAYCDADGSWKTQHVTFEYKVAVEDPYTVGVDHQVCATNAWQDFDLGGVSGRYVRVTFFCETACGGTQARELYLSEAPQVLPSPGLRLLRYVGDWKGGVLR